MTDIFNHLGKRVLLGKKIGAGGEGSVFEMPSDHNVVAKIYHDAISQEKQRKISSMARVCDDSLKKIAAWPLSVLHETPGGAVRGFIMPKVVGHEPIHHLYGPTHRKQFFPDKDWAFLINAARNTAAAFEVVHSHGHIIGDVNPNLLFVARNSIVKLVDCDSFQIASEGQHYLCEVGVPHFTPPELQGHTTFRGIRRTKNHDNFGLALLVFHLLLMGRHPFSGVFAGTGDLPLEKAISQFRYAFGANAATKSISPPPNSVTTTILSPLVIEMFARAFSEQGAQTTGRPTAQQWVKALDTLKGQLRACGHLSIHKYFNNLSTCPWCAQEQKAGILFFISLNPADTCDSHLDIGATWIRITAIVSPGAASAIVPIQSQVDPKPIPESVKSAKTLSVIKKVLSFAIVVMCFVFAIDWILLAIIIAIPLYFAGSEDSVERQVRQGSLSLAVGNMTSVSERWKKEAGDETFQAKLRELGAFRIELENLGKRFEAEKQHLQQTRQTSQMKKFLDGFFIENFDIAGIGPTRKVILASFGIETAADVTWRKVISVRGFGEKMTGELVKWRKGLEQKFVFNPAQGVDPADISALNQRFALKRKSLEGCLLAGPEQLTQIKQQILQYRTQLLPTVQRAALQVAQAEADLAVL